MTASCLNAPWSFLKTITRRPSACVHHQEPGLIICQASSSPLDLPVPGGNVQRTSNDSSITLPASFDLGHGESTERLGWRPLDDRPFEAGHEAQGIRTSGIFSSHRHPARKHLFISAGSGITPMMSMTAWAWDSGNMPDIVFVHAAKRPSEIIFRERLEQFANRVPGIQLRFTVEEADPFRAWHGYRGRLSQIMLGLMAPDYLEREVFCCGPEPFMQAVRDMLIALGFNMEHYHQESFGAPVRTEAEAPVLKDVVPARIPRYNSSSSAAMSPPLVRRQRRFFQLQSDPGSTSHQVAISDCVAPARSRKPKVTFTWYIMAASAMMISRRVSFSRVAQSRWAVLRWKHERP